jgi:hypothetical protein
MHLVGYLYEGRFHPFIGHKGPKGEQRYSSTLFLTSALEGGEGSKSCPGRTLPPGKTRYPLYRRLRGPQGRSGHVRKISSPPGFDPRTAQSVGSRYTDYATRPIIYTKKRIKHVACISVTQKWRHLHDIWQSSDSVLVGGNRVPSAINLELM